MDNDADHAAQPPDFRTIAQRHTQISEAHAHLSQEMELLNNLPAIDQGAAVLQQLAILSNNVNQRFTTIENRLIGMENRIRNCFTDMKNRVTAMETRYTARLTAIENRLQTK